MEYKKDKNIDILIRDTVFFGNNLAHFTFKRTVKIAKAVYLVSEIIKDIEPVKWSLRTVSASMMELGSIKDIRQFVGDVAVKINSIKSLVLLANFSKNVSDMNTSVIIRECDDLLFSLSDLDAFNKQYLALDKTFFDVAKAEEVSPFLSVIQNEKNNQLLAENYKGHVKDRELDMSFIKPSRPVFNKPVGQETQAGVLRDNAKVGRRKQILDIIQSTGEVTIKDISSLIKDCSEKTIQRELIGLLSDGLIKRTGDRRWSKYSLKVSV